MPSNPNAASLLAWLSKCPYLVKDSPLYVDYLKGEPVEYALFSTPCALQSHRNILGESVLDASQSVTYLLGATLAYGAAAEQNALNLGALEDIAAWIEAQNALQDFPSFSQGVIESIQPALTPYPVETTANSAKYQITIKLTYRRE